MFLELGMILQKNMVHFNYVLNILPKGKKEKSMTNDMMIYLTCIGICLMVVAVAVIIIFISNSKLKKKMAEFENEKQDLNMEKAKLASEQAQLRKTQEDLKNAQILFQREKEAQADLSKKTEKEVAIDLFIKFMEMESTFDFMKNNLASIDSKLVGVKDYSEDLASMENELTGHLNALKTEMMDMQKSYSSSLSSIYSDLKISLANIESHVEGIVSSITEREMTNLSQSVNSKLDQIENMVGSRMGVMTNTISQRLANLSAEFGKEIEKSMPDTIDTDDIQNAVERVLSRYTISDLDTYDVESAVRSVIDSKFSFSYSFEDEIRSAVHDEISSSLSDIQSEISTLGYKVDNIELAVNK